MTTDYLEEVELDSDLADEIQEQVISSYLDPSFTSHWRPYRVEVIRNKHLLAEYDEKQKDLLIRGRKGLELEERLGFVVEPSVGSLEAVVSVGLQTRESDYNPLGYSMVGVYVCRHADVCIQHALVKYPASTVLRLVVCKFRAGKQTTAIPRQANAPGFIEPTQGYDCHVSALPPQVTDQLQTQFDRSQAYLYEINKLLQPSDRPRQVLPYAVVTFTENGLHVPEVDAKPTLKEKLDGNPRLQQIIKSINSKADKLAQQKTGKVLMPGMPPGGIPPGLSPPNQLSPLGDQGPSHHIGGATSPSGAGSIMGTCIPQAGAATYPPPGSPLHVAVNGCLGGANGFTDSPGPETPTNPEVERNPQLLDVINRINSRLAAEEKAGKPELPNAKSLQGGPVIMGGHSLGLQYRLPGARPASNGVTQTASGLAGLGLAGTAINGAALTASAATGQGIMGAGPSPTVVTSAHQVGMATRTSAAVATGYSSPSPLAGAVLTDTGVLAGRFNSLAEAAQGFSLRGASPTSLVPAVSHAHPTILTKQVIDYTTPTAAGLYASFPGLQPRTYTTGVGYANSAAHLLNYAALGAGALSPASLAAATPLQQALGAGTRSATYAQVLKRSYSDAMAPLAEWDKRTKFC